jgi:hypothetical protein
METGNSITEIRNSKIETGNWELEAGNSKLQKRKTETWVMPQSRYRSGGFTPPFSGWRGKPAATFETETEALQTWG